VRRRTVRRRAARILRALVRAAVLVPLSAWRTT
jgi:hypothetical protein